MLMIILFYFVQVYNYASCEEMYTINLDLWKFGMSRDESICIYTNQVCFCTAYFYFIWK